MLRWGDVDFENNTLNVNKTEYNRVVTTTKTKASTRIIIMPSHLMTLLQKIRNQAKPKMTYVVFGEFHDSIATSTLDRQYDKYIGISKVKRIRLHDFRHSYASYLINKGIIISVVAARLGHSDVATTLNTYSHCFLQQKKKPYSRWRTTSRPLKFLRLELKKIDLLPLTLPRKYKHCYTNVCNS